MAEFWVFIVLVGCVVFLSLVLLVLLVESAVLTYEAWWYRRAKKRGTLGEGDGIWSGRLGGLFIQEPWGSPIGLGASVVESVLLGMLTEVWIAVLVFVLCIVLFIGMWIATFVMNTKRIPVRAMSTRSFILTVRYWPPRLHHELLETAQGERAKPIRRPPTSARLALLEAEK